MDDKESSSYGGEVARRRKCGGSGGFTLLRLHAHFSFFVSTPYVLIKRKPAADNYRHTRHIEHSPVAPLCFASLAYMLALLASGSYSTRGCECTTNVARCSTYTLLHVPR